MYLIASIIASTLITLFLVSKIANMLHAKRSGMGWIFLAAIAGSIFASLVLLPIDKFITGLDPIMMIALSLLIMLIVSSAAFKYINELNWSGAITTNIAYLAISVITTVIAIFINGVSVQETLRTLTQTATQNAEMVQSVANGNLSALHIPELASEEKAENTLEIEPVVTELDLLPPGAAIEKEARDKRVYVEPKYRVINISNIRSAVGKSIKIKKKSGNSLSGTLVKLSGRDAIVSQRIGSSGTATIPVVIAEIKTLEVYQ